jgi:hypothetical protein
VGSGEAERGDRETLTDKGRNRGLWFDREMLPYCGGVFHVRQQITRIIEEHGGCMLELTGDRVILDGVVCSGERRTLRLVPSACDPVLLVRVLARAR